MPRSPKPNRPSLLSLVTTAFVALLLFAGVVVVAKQLTPDAVSESIGYSDRNGGNTKLPEHSTPARAGSPQ